MMVARFFIVPRLPQQPFLLHIAQYLKHTLGGLLPGIHPIYQFAVLIVPHNNVFGRWNEAVFNAAVTTNLILISAGMKEAQQ